MEDHKVYDTEKDVPDADFSLSNPCVLFHDNYAADAALETSSSVAPSLGSSRPSPARRAALETRHKGCGLRNPASVRRVNSAFKLIKELKDRKGTLRGGELYTWRKLLPTEYQELQEELETESEDLAAYFEEGLGYNYSATYKRLTICMPGPCHESMKEQLTDGIKNWYGLLKPETPYVDGQKVTCTEATRRATGSIESYGETQFPLKSNRTQSDLQADGSFRHGLGDVPHVILEVSWTQKPGDLLKKCNDWIRQSNGVVRTIIAFDLYDIYWHVPAPRKLNSRKAKYLNQGKASFSVWRRDVNRGLMERNDFKVRNFHDAEAATDAESRAKRKSCGMKTADSSLTIRSALNCMTSSLLLQEKTVFKIWSLFLIRSSFQT
ncbi:hypothetical protein F5883DRAFT_585189 [Diaporthe sp. PMI_573]|nr:hypothetical protein F5883DRAFT_585189 [Diaporthaceae sp. PMI_573]